MPHIWWFNFVKNWQHYVWPTILAVHHMDELTKAPFASSIIFGDDGDQNLRSWDGTKNLWTKILTNWDALIVLEHINRHSPCIDQSIVEVVGEFLTSIRASKAQEYIVSIVTLSREFWRDERRSGWSLGALFLCSLSLSLTLSFIHGDLRGKCWKKFVLQREREGGRTRPSVWVTNVAWLQKIRWWPLKRAPKEPLHLLVQKANSHWKK